MARVPATAVALVALVQCSILFLGISLSGGVLGAPGGSLPPGQGVSASQKYRYRLVVGKERALCRHMNTVYNNNFSQPWRYSTYSFPPPWFPPLSSEQQQPEARSGLFSRYPTSPEFSAITWKESVLLGPVVSGTVLVAEFDIDNDGKNDLVLKSPLMDPWQQGAEDSLVVLDPGQVDLGKPIDPKDVYFRPEGLRRPALIKYMTLGFMGSWIRPFIYEGSAYLSVHEGGPQQSIWILRYKGGGDKIGRAPSGVQDSYEQDLARPWRPLEVEKLCRLRMIQQK